MTTTNPIPILPCGRINCTTGQNEYWTGGTNEVWSNLNTGKLFVVHTAGTKPLNPIGTVRQFRHDQTDKLLHRSAMMIGWFNHDGTVRHGDAPLQGKLPVATYK